MASVASAQSSDSVSTIVLRLASAQKSNRGAPGYSRWVNRPAGRVLAALAFKTGLSPNQVTAASAVLSFIAIALLTLVRPTLWFGVIFALLLALAYALDSADGQLARLRGGGSLGGEWLDHIVDCAKTSSIHLAILVCWFRFFDLTSSAMLLIPLLFSVQASVWFFGFILTEQLRAEAVAKPTSGRTDGAPVMVSVVKLPLDYGVLCLTPIFLWSQPLFICCYTALMLANVAFLLASLPRWYRSLQPTRT